MPCVPSLSVCPVLDSDQEKEMSELRALTLGAGFAGQGHSEAFRHHGVEIAGMVSRTKDVVERVAAEMSIP